AALTTGAVRITAAVAIVTATATACRTATTALRTIHTGTDPSSATGHPGQLRCPMLGKTFLTLSLLAAFAAQAQTTGAPASSPAKKELVARILKAQQPAIEALARGLVER